MSTPHRMLTPKGSEVPGSGQESGAGPGAADVTLPPPEGRPLAGATPEPGAEPGPATTPDASDRPGAPAASPSHAHAAGPSDASPAADEDAAGEADAALPVDRGADALAADGASPIDGDDAAAGPASPGPGDLVDTSRAAGADAAGAADAPFPVAAASGGDDEPADPSSPDPGAPEDAGWPVIEPGAEPDAPGGGITAWPGRASGPPVAGGGAQPPWATPSDGGPLLPPPPPPAAPPRRRKVRQYVAAFLVLLLTAFAVSAAVVPLPYYAFKPGSVRDTESLISVGGDTPVYPAQGSISYTTVSLRQATLFGLVQGWIDDDIDIHPEDEVLGDRDADENRTFNLALMDDSKNVAAQVALEHLGYEVPVTSDGTYVLDVASGSGADGLLDVGDVILTVDGEPLDAPDDLSRIMAGKAPGDAVALEVQSMEGERRDEDVTLTPAPDDPERGVMGVVVQARDIEYQFPIDVRIDTGDVGGPSAGLAFTLGILDDLTPGELTGGVPVAVTGTINPDGTVGPVGGTGQKAAAVRDAGAEVFLVPTADYEAAAARAGDVEVVAVDNIDEALRALADLGGNGLDLPDASELAAAAETQD